MNSKYYRNHCPTCNRTMTFDAPKFGMTPKELADRDYEQHVDETGHEVKRRSN